MTCSRGRREVSEGASGKGYDFHLLEESLLVIPGRTHRGEGTIISFPDGQVWVSLKFLHIPGEQRGGGGGEGKKREKMGDKCKLALGRLGALPFLP